MPQATDALTAPRCAHVTPFTPDKQRGPLTVHCERAPVLTAGLAGRGVRVSKHVTVPRLGAAPKGSGLSQKVPPC